MGVIPSRENKEKQENLILALLAFVTDRGTIIAFPRRCAFAIVHLMRLMTSTRPYLLATPTA
jgi:hypothetical protein